MQFKRSTRLLTVAGLVLGLAACAGAGADTGSEGKSSWTCDNIGGKITDTQSQLDKAKQEVIDRKGQANEDESKTKVTDLTKTLDDQKAFQADCKTKAMTSSSSTTAVSTTTTTVKVSAPPVDWTDPAKWPDLPTEQLGDPGPGRCFPRVLEVRQQQVKDGVFKSYEQDNGAIDFAPPYSPYELQVLQTDIVQIIHEGKVESTRPHCLDDLGNWLKAHEDYNLASKVIGRTFDPTKRKDLEDYYTAAKLVELDHELVVENHFFSVDNGVQPLHVQKLPAHELVFFVPGYEPGNAAHNPLRPVGKFACGNPLLPPPAPPTTPTGTTPPTGVTTTTKPETPPQCLHNQLPGCPTNPQSHAHTGHDPGRTQGAGSSANEPPAGPPPSSGHRPPSDNDSGHNSGSGNGTGTPGGGTCNSSGCSGGGPSSVGGADGTSDGGTQDGNVGGFG